MFDGQGEWVIDLPLPIPSNRHLLVFLSFRIWTNSTNNNQARLKY